MRHRLAAGLAGTALAGLLLARTAAAQTSLTIYNDGRVLVRRSLPLPVPAGTSTLRAALGQLDPGSLVSLDSTVAILEARHDGGTDDASILRRAVGRTLTLQVGAFKDTISATLLGVDPERWRLPDGSVTLSRPGTPRFPAELVPIDPAVELRLRAARAQKALALGWLTQGASWQAAYQVVMSGGQARVQGHAIVAAGALATDSAEISLFAGSVSRAAEQPGPQAYGRRVVLDEMKATAVGGAVSEERVGEFHLYSLPGKWSLRPGVTTAIQLFEPATTPVERAYVVRGAMPWYGWLPQAGAEQVEPVTVTYTLARARKTDFGEKPLPAGIARLYTADADGRLQLVGEASTPHTAAGKELRLGAGDAFDLTAKRIQTSYATKRDSTKAGWRTVATAAYKVTLGNATDSVATIDVLEERQGEWALLASSVPAEKLSSTQTRFRVKVPARGEAVLTYRVNVLW